MKMRNDFLLHNQNPPLWYIRIMHKGGIEYERSTDYLDQRDFVGAASIDGFTKYSWSGWQNLQQGDIIALNGHVEIFDHCK